MIDAIELCLDLIECHFVTYLNSFENILLYLVGSYIESTGEYCNHYNTPDLNLQLAHSRNMTTINYTWSDSSSQTDRHSNSPTVNSPQTPPALAEQDMLQW